MESITREGCELVLNEVYEGDISGFLERAEQFFSVMPAPDNEKATATAKQPQLALPGYAFALLRFRHH